MPKRVKKKFSLWLLSIPLFIALTVYTLVQTDVFSLLVNAGWNNRYDVIVVGASSGGISAAIQSARMGNKTLLLEDTDLIGGQLLTVSTMDFSNPVYFGGIYEEMMSKIKAYYDSRGLSIATCYYGNSSKVTQCFEPGVALPIIKEMIAKESNLTLMTKQNVLSVVKTGDTINGVVLQSGKKYQTKYLIDATEYGDIIVKAGDDYRIGNGTNTSPKSTACIQDITYPAVVKKYTSGVPTNLKITSAPPGYTEALKEYFRDYVVPQDQYNKDPESSTGFPWRPAFHNGYRGLPDSSKSVSYTGSQFNLITKTAINFANDYPSLADSSTLLNVKYLTDTNYRREVECNAKLRTIQYIYYMQTELGMSDWSVSTEEGFDTQWNRANSCDNIPSNLKAIEYNMPQKPYVRESIRGVGLDTLNGPEIDRKYRSPAEANKINDISIGLGDYNSDLHDCTEDKYLEANLGDTTKYQTGGGGWPFQIPMDILYSKKIKGLLYAEKNISQTRLANGATRLQPSTMVTGQAVGALAGVALKKGTYPTSDMVHDVQKELINRKAILAYFTDVSKDTTYFSDVQQASANGLISGYGFFNFKPANNLNRQELAYTTVRLFPLQPKTNQTRQFTDAPRTAANSALYALLDNGVTAGCSLNPLKYCPLDNTNTNQMSIIFYKSLQLTNPSKLSKYSSITDITTAAKAWFIDNKFTACTASNWSTCSQQPIKRYDFAGIVNKVYEYLK